MEEKSELECFSARMIRLEASVIATDEKYSRAADELLDYLGEFYPSDDEC